MFRYLEHFGRKSVMFMFMFILFPSPHICIENCQAQGIGYQEPKRHGIIEGSDSISYVT